MKRRGIKLIHDVGYVGRNKVLDTVRDYISQAEKGKGYTYSTMQRSKK